MGPIQRILVPFDGSAAGLHACNEAVELARHLSAELILLQVIEPSPYLLPREVTDEIRSMIRTDLERRSAKLRPHVRSVRALVSEGRPWEKIVEKTEEVGADVIVMGTHGRSGLSRAILGSVAERVVRLSQVPVLTVPEHVFADRTDAATRLVRALKSRDLEAPAVVSLSREALPIAAAISRALSGTIDLWLVASLVADDGRPLGAMGEDGAVLWENGGVVDEAARREAERKARVAIGDELVRLRGTRSMGPTGDRAIVVVTDGLATPTPAIVAAKALRALGPRQLLLAVPIAPYDTVSAVQPHFDGMVFLVRPVLEEHLAWYEHDQPLSDRDARHFLERVKF